MLEFALAYGRMKWRIFPCHSIVDGRCSCGKAKCPSPGKHPRTKGGFKEATWDESQIRRWWGRWPNANIALATGDGVAVFDIDGAEGFAEFKAFIQAHGKVPETLTSQTGRGVHLIFATRPGAPSVRSAARGKVHVRGDGGYIILPPSNHISGRNYQWLKKVRMAELPDNLRQWSQGYEVAKKSEPTLGPVPSYLTSTPTRDVDQAIGVEFTPAEHARLVSALAAIPSDNYEIWFQVGMALKALDWQTNESDIGFELFDAWSQTSPDKYALAACEDKWRSFGRRAGITIGTIYHLAREHGWNGGAPAPAGSDPPKALNGHANGAHALPAAFLTAQEGAIFFPDVTKDGGIKLTRLNAKVAIEALGVECRYDKFHNRLLVGGELAAQWHWRELTDPVIIMLRDRIRYKFGFDPGTQATRDASENLCYDNMFDPVMDYLDSLRWDGAKRLDNWLSTYLGVAANPYTQSVARLSLIAAVRRVRVPATKFDQIIVLEGKQGAGKSEAIRILAGPENFSDQRIIGVDERKQQELTEGVWLYEIAELAGLRRADMDSVKAFMSRTTDRARPAYGRYVVHQERRTTFFGSVNPGHAYLQDETGNRRFWPVVVGSIDLIRLRHDRDQLWAEAATLEAQGASIGMPENLWMDAHQEQEKRNQTDEWAVPISNYIALKGHADYSIMEILTDNQWLQIGQGDVDFNKQNRAGKILRGLKYERFQKRMPNGHTQWRWRPQT